LSTRRVQKKYIYRSFYTTIAVLFFVSFLLCVFRVNDNIGMSGVIKSKSITYIKCPCDTYLKKVYVIPGEEVKKGRLLAELDETGISKSIQEIQFKVVENNKKIFEIQSRRKVTPFKTVLMEQDINQCQIKLENARIAFETSQKLYQDGAISRENLRQSSNEYAILQGELIKLQNTLAIYKIENDSRIELEKQIEEEKLLNLQLDSLGKRLALLQSLYASGNQAVDTPGIFSPCDGVVTAIGVEVSNPAIANTNYEGKILRENETVFEISDPNDIYIEGLIRENDFPFVFDEDRVYLKIAAYSYQKYGVFEGIIDKLYKEPLNVNGNNMYKCEVRLTNVKSNREIKTYLGLSTSNTINVKKSYTLIRYMFKKVFEYR
jgi:multidrug resistance efflux pump